MTSSNPPCSTAPPLCEELLALARGQAIVFRARSDLAMAELDRLQGLIQQGSSPWEILKALRKYTQRFSRFHVELSRLHSSQKDERSFISGLSDDLQQHLEQLAWVEENVQPAERIALDEAMNHVRSALEIVEGAGRREKRQPVLQLQEVPPESPAPPETKFTNEGPNRLISRKP